MSDIFGDMTSLMGAIAAGPPSEQDIHDRTEVAGLTVSTVRTPDCGWETAIVDAQDVYIVERYGDDHEAAVTGHDRWVGAAPSLTHVTDVGYGSSIEPEEHELVREAEEVPA